MGSQRVGYNLETEQQQSCITTNTSQNGIILYLSKWFITLRSTTWFPSSEIPKLQSAGKETISFLKRPVYLDLTNTSVFKLLQQSNFLFPKVRFHPALTMTPEIHHTASCVINLEKCIYYMNQNSFTLGILCLRWRGKASLHFYILKSKPQLYKCVVLPG